MSSDYTTLLLVGMFMLFCAFVITRMEDDQ